MVRLNRHTPNADELALDRYLDMLMRADPGAPTPLPIEPIDLTSLAYQMHAQEGSARSRPAYADRLLINLHAAHPELQTMNAPMSVGTQPLATPVPWIEITNSKRTRLGWAAIIAILIVSGLILALWNPIDRNDNTPILIAPTAVGSPDTGTPASTATPRSPEGSSEVIWRTASDMVGPTGLRISPDGNLWAIDSGNNRICIITTSGEPVDCWGEAGSGEGQFDFIREDMNPIFAIGDVDWDSSGNFYVSAAGNRRIDKFSADRTFQLSWGETGGGPGQFSNVFAIAVDKGDVVFVVDDKRNIIQTFDTNGTFIRQLLGSGTAPGQIFDTGAITLDGNGNIWIADWGNNRIQKFTNGGELIVGFGEAGSGPGQFNHPAKVVLDQHGNLFVSDIDNHRIQVFDPAGRFLMSIVDSDNANSFRPSGLALGPDGTLYANDADNGRMIAFRVSLPTNPPSTEDVPGYFEGQPSFEGVPGTDVSVSWPTGASGVSVGAPASVTVAPDGTIWVPDESTNTIHVVDQSGVLLETWGEPGSGPGQFTFSRDDRDDNRLRQPNQVLFLADGSFLVADSGNNRIQHFAADRSYIAQFGATTTETNSPQQVGTLFLRPDGTIAVNEGADSTGTTYEVVVFDQSGSFLRRETLNGSFALAFLDDGSYWSRVDEQGIFTAVRFSATGEELARLNDPSGTHDEFVWMGMGPIDANGNIYLANNGNHEVSVWSRNGTFIASFNGNNSGVGRMNSPMFVALDAIGGVYVVDSASFNLARYQVTLP